jgi:hypothetical protein
VSFFSIMLSFLWLSIKHRVTCLTSTDIWLSFQQQITESLSGFIHVFLSRTFSKKNTEPENPPAISLNVNEFENKPLFPPPSTLLPKSSCPRYQTQMTLLCYGFQTHPRFQWSVCLTFPLT